jgi:hypothetical protein
MKEKRSHKSEATTFRIDHSIMEDLRKESRRKKEDLHVLINQILRFYVIWHKPSYVGGNIPFQNDLF